MKVKEIKEQDIYGGNFNDVPNEKYQKFFDTFKELNDIDVQNWKVSHIIGYFCNKYYNVYNKNYKFKFNNQSPSKCFEVFQIKKLSGFLSSKPEILKSYIDWIFNEKIIKNKKRITSISFLNFDSYIYEYKSLYLNSNLSIDRTSNLPDNYKNIFNKFGLSINTYGELAFAASMDDMPENIFQAFKEIECLGFKKDILKRIL